MLLAEIARTSADVTATSARLRKVSRLAECLERASAVVLESTSVRGRIEAMGGEVPPQGSAAFAAMIAREAAKWARIVERTGTRAPQPS